MTLRGVAVASISTPHSLPGKAWTVGLSVGKGVGTSDGIAVGIVLGIPVGAGFEEREKREEGSKHKIT